MVRRPLFAAAAALALLAAHPAAAQDQSGPWTPLMTFGPGVVGREARPAVSGPDGLEVRIIIAWRDPDDAAIGDYMLGRFLVNCDARQASAMEAVTMSLTEGELSRESRERPNWGDAAPGSPSAALIGVLCDGRMVQDGPLHADAAPFAAAARRTPPAP